MGSPVLATRLTGRCCKPYTTTPLDMHAVPEHHPPVVPEQCAVQQSRAVPDPHQPEIRGCAKGGTHLPGVCLSFQKGSTSSFSRRELTNDHTCKMSGEAQSWSNSIK